MTSSDVKPEEGVREVPIVEEDFATLLEKFRIKPEVAKNIAENISHIGGQTVFEDPGLLMKKLASWSTDISPAKRKLIIEQWFAERGIEVPEEVIVQAGKGPTELQREAKDQEAAEKIYVVDSETGILRLAVGNERGTTLSEAQRLQKSIKKDLEEARKREEADSGGAKEPAFVVGEGGAWTLNPKGKIGFGEFAVFQMYQDSLRRGEPIDPVEELTRREEQSARLKEALGVKPGGEDPEMTWLDRLDKLGLLRKSGEEGRSTQIDMLDKLNQLGLLKQPGEGEGTSLTIKALETKIEDLKESLQKQELDTLKGAVGSLINQISDMRKEIANGGKLEGRYALLEKTIAAIDTQLTGIRTDAKPILAAIGGGGGPPSKRSPEDKAKLARGLKQALALEEEAKTIEDELLFVGKPAEG